MLGDGPIDVRRAVRELSDGRVLLVNADAGGVILDSSLTEARRIGWLPMKSSWIGPADTTYFGSTVGRSFIVVDPAGKIVRRGQSINSPRTVHLFVAGPDGGRLDARSRFLITADARSEAPDSADLVWVDLAGRYEFTGVTVRVKNPWGVRDVYGMVDLNDAWTALPDGSIFVFRSRGCRAEVFSSTGVSTQGPTVPCPARLLTAEVTRRRLSAVGSTEVVESGSRILDMTYVPTSILSGPDGRVWLQRNPFLEDNPYGDTVYDVFDATGRIVDAFTIRRDRRVVGLGSGVVYMARLNDGLLERVSTR
jgi:hypothetical protein